MHPEIFANSPKDFDGAITNQIVNFNCKVCGKPVTRKFRLNRRDTFDRMMCLECNMSYLAKQDPDKFQRSLESNRRNHGGMLSSQINLDWNKAGIAKNQSKEGREKIRQRIKENPELLESKHLNYFGVKFDSIPEFCVYVGCLIMNIPIIRNIRELSFQYIDSLGYSHDAYPDFIINGVAVEIKGKQFYKSDGTWTIPFRKKTWSDERYLYECNKLERKRQCLIQNNVVILKDIDDWVKNCVNIVETMGINPRLYLSDDAGNFSYGYHPYNVDVDKLYQNSIIYINNK